MRELYGEVRDELTLGVETLSHVSKALYVMRGKPASARALLEERYDLSEAEAELVYDAGRPKRSHGPDHVFERLAPLTDTDDPSYTEPDHL